jgi:hypothetical protein
MTKTAQNIIAGVEVLTIVTECYGGGGSGGTDKRGETKMTVLVGENGAMSIMDAINAAGAGGLGALRCCAFVLALLLHRGLARNHGELGRRALERLPGLASRSVATTS